MREAKAENSQTTWENSIQAFAPELTQIRRMFHMHPELSTQEVETGRKIMEYLDRWGIPYRYPVADTGIVALLEGKAEGQEKGNTVAIRADMDALPLEEDPYRSYCSQNPGVMHACGHDAHLAIALGVGCLLKKAEKSWRGRVKLLFQPAEETIGGAKRMVEEGCMENPHVDYVIGLHMMPSHETGKIEVKHGKLNAATNDVKITVHGASCHGAYPEQGQDAIVMAASLVTALQTLVSRNISPLNQAVLTLGTIKGGTAGNILAGQVEITGTLRTTDPETRAFAIGAINRYVKGVCAAYGGWGEASISPGFDALVNTGQMVDLLVETAAPIIGMGNIVEKEAPSMGGEDFSFFLGQAPGVFYHLGCGCQKKGITAPLHTSQFDIDEDSLALGLRLQLALAQALLERDA